MNRSIEVLRIFQCCSTYKKFEKLPKLLTNTYIKSLEYLIYQKNIDHIDNTLNVNNYISDCYLLKINLDITSSVNSLSNNIFLIDGIYNYILSKIIYKLSPRFNKIFTKYRNIISPQDILKLDYLKVNMANNKKYIDHIQNRMNEKIIYKTTAMYYCPKCKQRKTRVQEMQLRCGDEGGTSFIECVVCGYSWKKNA